MVAKSRLTLRAIHAPLVDTIGHVVPKVVPDSLQVAPLGSACFMRYCPACRQFRGFLAGQTIDRQKSNSLLQSQYRAPGQRRFLILTKPLSPQSARSKVPRDRFDGFADFDKL